MGDNAKSANANTMGAIVKGANSKGPNYNANTNDMSVAVAE